MNVRRSQRSAPRSPPRPAVLKAGAVKGSAVKQSAPRPPVSSRPAGRLSALQGSAARPSAVKSSAGSRPNVLDQFVDAFEAAVKRLGEQLARNGRPSGMGTLKGNQIKTV